ncbi:MAG: type II toxin-antitoxin system HicB family antitoxin [Armatimonadota bacterium]|nr:type II toxin-antitoxin system HicB family antitoxin [bacterium]MDW8289138.1 type II toxin-antitoxin system HicB family antitoxin [Armatimonadota bacterium]
MKTFGKTYRAIVEPDEPKGFVAVLPAVLGLIAHGDSEEEAVALLRELLQAHLLRLEQARQPLPEDDIEIAWDEEDEEAGAKLVLIEV